MGFASGLGAATADALYGLAAGFGLTIVAENLIRGQNLLSLIGGGYLMYLGIKSFIVVPRGTSIVPSSTSLGKAYASTFILTLTNPITILSFTAIFAGLGLVTSNGDAGDAVLLVAGVTFGSALWWFILSSVANFFKNRLSAVSIRWINRTAGIIIMGIGILIFLNLFRTI